jgi:hypothetical protein
MRTGLPPVPHRLHTTYYHDEEVNLLFHTVMRACAGPRVVVPIPEDPQCG